MSIARRLAALVGTADPDVRLWRLAVMANGGWVSPTRLAVVTAFVAAEKAAGTWARTDDYWGLWAENSIQALTSLKQRRLGGVINSPTFEASRGYQGDGTSSYIDTGFIPSAHGIALGLNDIRLAAYERNVIGGSGATAGANATSSRTLHMRGSGGTFATFGAPASFTITGPTNGFTAGSRRGPLATDQVLLKNAVAMTRTVDATSLAATLGNVSLFICCLNSGGSPQIFRASQIGMVAIGASMSDALEVAQYNNVQAWATAIGAQV